MTADLPPDVRAEAVHAARGEWMRHGARWDTVVAAVTAVVAPEIERPLQAQIAQLKTENLHLSLELEARDDSQWDLHQRLLPELAEAKEENRRLHDVVHRERPSVGDMVIELPQLRAERDARASMSEPDPLPVHEREVRAYAAESGDVVLRRHLTAVLAELDRVREENAELREWKHDRQMDAMEARERD